MGGEDIERWGNGRGVDGCGREMGSEGKG